MIEDPVALAKAALRRSAETARAAAHAAVGAEAAEALARHGIQVLAERSFRSVAGYWPMRTEIDLRPLLIALANTGREVALPAVTRLGQPLDFRRWRPGMALATGRFGTQHPPEDAKRIEPDVLLIPLLAFDRRHFRLGYGAGFYDRTLADLRARKTVLAVGVGFAAQRVEAVPVDPWDQRLDLVLTEQGIM